MAVASAKVNAADNCSRYVADGNRWGGIAPGYPKADAIVAAVGLKPGRCSTELGLL